MNAKKLTILIAFTVLLVFNVVSRLFFNDFQNGWNAYEKKDYKTAREIWLPMAEQGHLRAQFLTGFMHDMGFGVPEDDKEAIKWYELAAEQGDSRAQLFAGYIYEFGHGDHKKAVKWYQLANKQGYKQAREYIYNLAKKNSPEALKILTEDAENGDAKAQKILAGMYELGQGVQQDYKEAVKWYQRVNEKTAIYSLSKKNSSEALKILTEDAENGDAKAQKILAGMYELGQGVQQDYKEAVKWYQRVNAKTAIYSLAKKNVSGALKILVNDAENGNIEAQRELSVMYQLGLGVPQDNHEFVKWYRFVAENEFAREKNNIINLSRKNIPQALKALSNDAENGNVEAQIKLGMMYQHGIELPKDEKEAAKWYRLAAEQGDNKAQSILGLMYSNGQGVPKDDQETLKWYRLAAGKKIVSEKSRIYDLAKQNVPQALKILTRVAENGNVEAQMKLGMMQQFGLGVPKNEKEAANWYLLAAEKGDPKAQSNLGLMYSNGQGVPKDDQEAMKWYRLAAENKVASERRRIYNLAKKNDPQALEILTDDAENGVAEAQYFLGNMNANGLGVPYDLVLAHMWYNLSGLRGYEGVTSQINLVEKQMSPQQIEKAQEMVRGWKPSPL